MKLSIALTLFVFTACTNRDSRLASTCKRIIPDTTKTWAGRQTRDAYNLTRNLETKFGLKTLTNGSSLKECRIWQITSSSDPQGLLIVRQNNTGNWSSRSISFFHANGDKINSDKTNSLRQGFEDSINLKLLWSLPSQSDLSSGDFYSCTDGDDMLIEMADPGRYRLMWYRCPDKNKYKDSVFHFVSDLGWRIHRLTDTP